MKYFIQIVLIGAIIYLIYVLYMMYRLDKQKKRQINSQGTEAIKRDPICGTYVPESQGVKLELNGKTQVFCSMKCLEKYQDQTRREA